MATYVEDDADAHELATLREWSSAAEDVFLVRNPRGAAVRESAQLDSTLLGVVAGGSVVRIEARETLGSGKVRARVVTSRGQRGWSTFGPAFFGAADGASVAAAEAAVGARVEKRRAAEARLRAARRSERLVAGLAAWDGGVALDALVVLSGKA